jgi:hypothetical protein
MSVDFWVFWVIAPILLPIGLGLIFGLIAISGRVWHWYFKDGETSLAAALICSSSLPTINQLGNSTNFASGMNYIVLLASSALFGFLYAAKLRREDSESIGSTAPMIKDLRANQLFAVLSLILMTLAIIISSLVHLGTNR